MIIGKTAWETIVEAVTSKTNTHWWVWEAHFYTVLGCSISSIYAVVGSKEHSNYSIYYVSDQSSSMITIAVNDLVTVELEMSRSPFTLHN